MILSEQIRSVFDKQLVLLANCCLKEGFLASSSQTHISLFFFFRVHFTPHLFELVKWYYQFICNINCLYYVKKLKCN